MSTANVVFKINEVVKEVGFTLKGRKKYKIVSSFSLLSTSMEYRQDYSSFLFLITKHDIWVHCLGQSSRSSRFLEE